MPDDAALARAREVRDRIWHRMKQVLDDGDSLVGRNESLRVVLDDEIAAALRAYGGEQERPRMEYGPAMTDDAALARAREAVREAWVLWGQRKGWTLQNRRAFSPSEWEPFVNVVAAALRAYGGERERQRAEEDAKIADCVMREEREYQNKSFNTPAEVLAAVAAHTAGKIAGAIRARGEKEAGG